MIAMNAEPQAGVNKGGTGSRTAEPVPHGDSHLLVNLTVERPFDYRILYRLTSLALKTGGILEHCNGEIAMFAFPARGVVRFMEEVGYRVQVARTLVSQRDSGSSVVNVRFLPRAA